MTHSMLSSLTYGKSRKDDGGPPPDSSSDVDDSSDAADSDALEDLRQLTSELGDDSDTDAEEESVTKWVSVVIFAPEYAPEMLTVAVRFPCTPADFTAHAQAARAIERRSRFPGLQAVLPQPGRGTGFFVAMPHWQPDTTIVHLDITAVDGRAYAAHAPTYADKATLCNLADLPDADNIAVYVGVSSEPLEGESLAHIVPGFAILFVPAPDPPPPAWDLALLLLRSRSWSPEHQWAPPQVH
ncbi:unnamed protein product, partial [Symbiodinium necroappetens]